MSRSTERATTLTDNDLDAMAWQFLGSEYAGPAYLNWPLQRRLDAYLLHEGLVRLADDGNACEALLSRVMDTIGQARRSGALAARTPSGPAGPPPPAKP